MACGNPSRRLPTVANSGESGKEKMPWRAGLAAWGRRRKGRRAGSGARGGRIARARGRRYSPPLMPRPIEILLLLALPASGKSEVRRYLAHLSPEQSRDEFHLGPTVQLDDFPYVHLMRRIDDELAALGQPRLFFQSPERPMIDPRDWGTLIALLN